VEGDVSTLDRTLDRSPDWNPDRRRDAFPDERMSAAERTRFQIQMVPEPGLAAAADLHRDVELSLRRSFAVPDLSGLIGRVEAAAAQIREGVGRDTIEGAIRWLAAAAALLFMLLTACVSTLIAPVSATTEGGSMVRWKSTWTEAVGLSLATASALMASGVRLRRDRDGRLRLHRFGTSVALPPGVEVLRTERASIVPGGCTLLVRTEDAVEPVTLIIAAASPDPRPARVPQLDGRRYFRRELDSVVLYAVTDEERPSWLDGCAERTVSVDRRISARTATV
jgi:hypothetical protein